MAGGGSASGSIEGSWPAFMWEVAIATNQKTTMEATNLEDDQVAHRLPPAPSASPAVVIICADVALPPSPPLPSPPLPATVVMSLGAASAAGAKIPAVRPITSAATGTNTRRARTARATSDVPVSASRRPAGGAW
jgi:hypothetical protein